ncbi:MAG: glycosyltransferase family 4 protein [Bacteroidota bacterium]|nr:glycosyltransferase family 4 protein [Bacteroidota bacterium]
MLKNLWIVSEYFYPDESATGYYLTTISEKLGKYYNTNVICGWNKNSIHKFNSLSPEVFNGINIYRCKSTVLNKNVLLFRFINLVTISFSIFFKSISKLKSGDYVIVVTNPLSLPFVVSIACWLKKANCVLLIHDVYPNVLIATGLLKKDWLITRFLNWITVGLYNRVDNIIVLGHDMEKIILNKLVSHTKIHIITNWADLKEIFPCQRKTNSLLKKMDIQDKFVVQYSGNMGRTHGLEILIDASKKLEEIDKIHFLFIGTGAKRNWLERSVKSYGLKNVALLPPQPRSNLCDTLNACDVAIISFIPGMLGLSVPSRMYNILAAGKPIIAVTDSDSELAIVVREENIGWIVSPDNPEQLVATIIEATRNSETLKEMGERSRIAAENKYSLDVIINAYRNLIENT